MSDATPLPHVPSGSIILLRQSHNPPARFVDRIWNALASMFAAIPIINGVSAAANRADWEDVACLINYSGTLRVIHYGPVDGINQIGLTPLDEFVQQRGATRYTIRKLHSTNADTNVAERIIDATKKLPSGSSTAWQTDPVALLCDIYFGAFGFAPDYTDRTKTVAELFGTGGAIDNVLYTLGNRTYLLSAEQ